MSESDAPESPPPEDRAVQRTDEPGAPSIAELLEATGALAITRDTGALEVAARLERVRQGLAGFPPAYRALVARTLTEQLGGLGWQHAYHYVEASLKTPPSTFTAAVTVTCTGFATVRVLEGEAPPPPTMLVDRLLLDGDVNIFGGPGGAGKSILLLTVAVHVALGTPCFGTLPVARSGPVVIVAPEDGAGFVRMALEAICTGMGLDGAQRATVAAGMVMVADDQVVNLAVDTNRLKHTVRGAGAVLLVLDPLRNILPGGEEASNDVAGLVIDQLRRDVCRGTGAAVAISHHHRKRSREQQAPEATITDDLRGASAWGAGARLLFSVSKAENARTVRLVATKSNRLRTEDLRHDLALAITAKPGNAATWTALTLTDMDDGSSVSLTPGLGRSLKENERAALGVLADEPDTTLTWSQWRSRSGIEERTFTNVKARLGKAGLAEAVPTTRRAPGGGFVHVYRITPAGRNALFGDDARVEE